MKGKMKRILAFLCAVVLVVTTFLGSWYTKQAKAANNVVPVTLDDFDNLTISDFEGDGWRNQGQPLTAMTVAGGECWGYKATDLTNFDKKLVSLKVTFKGGSYTNSILFGGNETWLGFNIYPNADGSALVMARTWGKSNTSNNEISTTLAANLPSLSATTAGVDSFIGEELLLQMSFEYVNEADGKADLKLGFYINGNLYNNEVFTIPGCYTNARGARLAFYPSAAGTDMIVGEEVKFPAGPVTVAGFDNLTLSDFEGDGWRNQGQPLNAMTVNGGEYWGYKATGLTSFDKKLVSLKVTFKGGSYTNSIVFGGNETWLGFNIYPNADGSALVMARTWGKSNTSNNEISTTVAANLPSLSATTAGVDSFIGEELLLQMSFEYVNEADGKADLNLGFYINGNLYNDEVFTIPGCYTNARGARLAFYPSAAGADMIVGGEVVFSEPPVEPTEPTPVELDGYQNVTIQDFVDADDTSVALAPGTGTSAGYKRYLAPEYTGFNKTLLSMKLTLAAGTYATRLDLAGGSEKGGWYSGLWMFADATGDNLTFRSCSLDGSGFYGTTDAYQEFNISKTEASVNSFINDEFILQIAFDFGATVGGKADLTLGVYIDGALAKTHTFTGVNVAKFGNYLNFVNGVNITYDNVIFSTTPDNPNPPVGTEEPVELDGYTNLTFRNFVDADDTSVALTPGTGTSTGYKRYLAPGYTDFDNVVLSMKLTLAAGTFATRMDLAGGNEKNGWYSGLWMFADATGDNLTFRSCSLDGSGFYGTTDAYQEFNIGKTEAGVNSFINDEFILQIAFDFGETVSGKADLTLGVYIDGALAKTHTFTGCNLTKFGNYLNFVQGTNITYDNVVLASTPEGPNTPVTPPVNPPVNPGIPVILDGFRNLTISDFVGNSSHTQGTTLTEGRYEAPNYYGYDVKGVENFDRKLISLNVTFDAGGWQNSILFGGNGQWVGFNLYPSADGSQLFISKTWGSTITSSATPILSAQTAGVDSFVGEEFLLQMSFEYGQEVAGKADLKLGIYIEGILYNNQVFTIANCNTSTFGDRLAFYPQTEGKAIIIGEEVDMPKSDDYEEETLYQKITFDSFGIADGKYTYVSGKTAVSGTALGRETLNKTVICGDILYEGSDNSQIIWGGTSAMNGLRMNPKSDGTMELAWYDGNNKTSIATLDSQTAGVDFIGEKYGIKLSSELVDADKDGKVNDLKIGVSFNGLLYNKEYFYVNDMGDKYGSYFSVYCAEKGDTVTLNSAPELVSRKPNADFEKVTFEYFALADGTYKCDGTDQSTFSSKGLETLDRKVLCGDILIDGEGRHSIMLGGKQIWYGLRFITQADGSILLIWVDEDGTPFIETFNSAIAGTTLIGEWMNLMISTEIVDADGDGEKDDIEFGFWFNGVLYNDKYYTIKDKASRLGKCFGFDCAEEGTSISVRSIPEYVKGFDYSIYGLTEDWEKTLLDTDFKVYQEVGGSRNPEPFTGDFTAIGNALRVFGTAMIIAIGACVCVVLQRRKNDRG